MPLRACENFVYSVKAAPVGLTGNAPIAVVLCAANLEARPGRVNLRSGSYEDDGSVWMPELSYSTEVHL